jgi:ATP-dependent Zn protease
MEQHQSVAARLGGGLIDWRQADVGRGRERARRRRLTLLAAVLFAPLGFLWYRILSGAPFDVFAVPAMPEDPFLWVLPLFLVVAIGSLLILPLIAGRSPHVTYRPEQIATRLSDVKALDTVVDEVVRTLNTFLGYAAYRDELGGTPRRGLLFEGPPGTGKTHLAKAMAREAGVPFLFVSATSFQSMYYGATARKIRSYFRTLRKVARREGGAIGFIEEIDAIGMTRKGLSGSATAPAGMSAMSAMTGMSHSCARIASGVETNRMGSSESAGGVVNELLVQLQSFDAPTSSDKLYNALVDTVNGFLPTHRQLRKRTPEYANILVIAATNRADGLDPALVRPGRFDRRLEFELPAKHGRRELIDHFLVGKRHAAELDLEERRDQLAGQTLGYTPVMIEHLLDEALVTALREGRDGFGWTDIQHARLNGEVGLRNPVPYTDRERLTVATHEAGHATVAYLAGMRRLEILSIVKRKGSLGLLAHGDLDEIYQRSRSEMFHLVDIAMGGLAAERVFFGESGTGPGGDLAAATQNACQIVGVSGMTDSLVSIAAVQSGALSDTNLVGRVLSDPALRPKVDDLLEESRRRVTRTLRANRHIVEALRDALLERDELIGEEITAVAEAAGPPVVPSSVEDDEGAERVITLD